MRALMAVGLMMSVTVTVQAQMQMPPIPVDKDVRIGKLPNGLTYYIRHNETPKGQADFYIAQKVGSILEDDHQRGLAHFLEHMCFNGTTNFPGNQIIDWLESKGVKFGQNLNAYTGVDETVYNISNVPIADVAVQDSCLLILHDWANELLLDPEEIDKERGVIHQEWRRSMVGQMRIIENILPTIYPDSKYGYRLPIGTMEVVDNFPPQALRDYYETWYRPDQQGVVVVGDIDVDRIEGKIKEMFSDIEMPENAKPREYTPVADNEGTIYAIGSDKEQQYAIVSLMLKTDAMPNEAKVNQDYLLVKYMVDMITSMLNNRLNEISTDPNAAFAQAGSYYGNFFLAKTKDAVTLQGVAKDNDIKPVLESMYRELLRAQRGGFTFGEYERASKEYLSRLEKAYNNRNNRESEGYVKEYVRHFIDNEPIPSVEDEYKIMQQLVPLISVDMINAVIQQLVTPDNRVVMALLPEKEGSVIPTEAQLAEVMAKVDAETIEPYVDQVKSEPLIPNLPVPGKIVSESHNDRWDATELVLSNGIKVLVKPTKFKEDEIRFSALAVGGTSVVPDEKAVDLKSLELVLSQNGLGDYTYSDLQKYLSGKQAGLHVSFDDYVREVMGTTTPKDLPTLMELIYMTFTNVNITPDEYLALQNQMAGILANQEANPQFIFSRDLMKAIYANPRKQMITSEEVRAANRESILEIVHNMTANAADYTFMFVGNVDMESFRPLIEQYIATLPADAANLTNSYKADPTLEVKTGTGIDTTTTKMETPQTYVFLAQIADMPYTPKGRALASIAGQVLSKRLLKTVREDMGAVYSIGAYGGMKRQGEHNTSIQSSFPMKPEMKQEVLDFIAAEIARMESDVKPEEVSSIIEFMVKEAKEGKEKNEDWIDAMSGFMMNGVDTFNGNVELLQSITTADVMSFMKDLRKANNYRVVVLDPAAAEK